ncbi:hypothetical protein EDD85DRAFT_950412 [Armillaria nabsnona]|nr:hypothetical protein EDD85DRAFT_950412 [Armillaria nabsnona]
MDPHDVSQSLHDIRAVGVGDTQLTGRNLSIILTAVLVASATLMIHEWAILFDQEVSLMWQSPWSLVKVLYLISRYSPILDVVIAIEEHIRPRVNPKICRTYDDISITERKVYNDYRYSCELTIVQPPSDPDFADMCPVWEQQESGLWACLYQTWVAVNLWVLIKYFKSSVSHHSSLLQVEPQRSPVLPGCYLASADPIFFICFASLLLLDALQLILQVYKAIKLLRGSRTPLVSTFFRDGVLYYMCLFPLALANVLVILLAPVKWLAGLVGHIDACLSQYNVLPVAARTSPGSDVEGNRNYAYCSSRFKPYGVPNANSLQ